MIIILIRLIAKVKSGRQMNWEISITTSNARDVNEHELFCEHNFEHLYDSDGKSEPLGLPLQNSPIL